MSNSKTYAGSCFCGEVTLTVQGDPVAMGYCHCESCRSWSAGPVNAFTLWPADAVTINSGESSLTGYNKTENSLRKWCTKCGGHVLSEHPSMGVVDVFAATIHGLPFEPAVHVHYGESVLPIKDGLPKMKDLPAEMGGSGDILPE